MSIYDDLRPCAANNAPLSPVRFLERGARYFSGRCSVVDGARSWTWEETGRRCRALASALTNMGVSRSDTVSVIARNGVEIFEAQFGIPLSGAVINNVNVRTEASTLAHILNHNQAKVLLVEAEFFELAQQAIQSLINRPIVVDILPCDEQAAGRLGSCTYEDLLSSGDPEFQSSEPLDELQPLSLNYTSGTTGMPKGVVYDHRNAFVESLGNLVALAVADRPSVLWAVPIFHANGWCFPWAMAGIGATNVLVRKPSGAEMLDLIAAHQITHIFGAPVIAQMIANAPGANQFRCNPPSRMLTAGSPPGSMEFLKLEEMGIQLDQGYGLTEVWGPVVFREPQDEWDSLPPIERARLKLHQGIPNLVLDEMLVVDPESGRPVPRDGQTLGEVQFRGNVVMRGYLADPKATDEAFSGGYFHSGDLAVWHPDGSIQIKDRIKDIIISGGENISSIELENVISEVDGVMSVAVIGVPDDQWGERPWAIVETADGIDLSESEILLHCRDRLAAFKLPKGVTFGTIPRTATGKVQKFVLRQEHLDRL